MSKKIISIMLSVLMVASMMTVLGISVFAASADDLTYEVIDGKATITGCDMTVDGTLVIPETIDGYTVNAIGDYAFALCLSLDEISIPATVKTIGEEAFNSCTSLTKVTVYSETADFSMSGLGYSAYDVFDGMQAQFEIAYYSYVEAFMAYEESGYDVDLEMETYLAYLEMLNYAEECAENPVKIDLVITGYADSAVEVYAADNGFTFVSIGSDAPETPDVTPDAPVTPEVTPDVEPDIDTDTDNSVDFEIDVDLGAISEVLGNLFSEEAIMKIIAVILKLLTLIATF